MTTKNDDQLQSILNALCSDTSKIESTTLPDFIPMDKITERKENGDRPHVKRSGYLLNKLFMQMLDKMNVTNNKNRWDQLMHAYITDPRNSIQNNKRDQSMARGNLQKELSKTKMSWNVFCKAMKFLNLPRFELIVKTTDNNGKNISFNLPVDLGEPNVIDENIINQSKIALFKTNSGKRLVVDLDEVNNLPDPKE